VFVYFTTWVDHKGAAIQEEEDDQSARERFFSDENIG
jgi:hypothetical protein